MIAPKYTYEVRIGRIQQVGKLLFSGFAELTIDN